MAHAEPDTSMPCLNFESPVLWPIKTQHDKMDTNSQEYVLMGLHIISCIVTARTSRPNVSRCCFERLISVLSRTSGTDVSVSSRCCHSNVSISSRSCHSEVLVSSESRLWRLALGIIRVAYTTLFCRPMRNCSMANRLHIAKQRYGCACQNGGGFHSRARLQFTNIERSKIFRVYVVGQLANKVRVRV